ncbi:hypothetical protein [Paludisphaera mucosa]|uniref:Uncharacterized protein n=1 Tax=Paludisphaera mucosa TaxID=3030827 RepID=A0ABT6F9E1_9BACT|nr:hypothetical protein [Paludisphaera mucosa]MDG3004201.1 hypothetical protein [Paludisphaera mucosa]
MSTAEMSATMNSTRMLIDARLDAIDRALLGRVSRAERMDVVGEVESRIDELLRERVGPGREPSRDDVLAVLARIDPPEAYLGDEGVEPRRDPVALRPAAATGRLDAAGDSSSNTAKASAILGAMAAASSALFPIGYGLGALLSSELALFLLWGFAGLFMTLAGTMAVVLAITGGVWRPSTLVGLSCGSAALGFALAAADILFFYFLLSS